MDWVTLASCAPTPTRHGGHILVFFYGIITKQEGLEVDRVEHIIKTNQTQVECHM
jgi:hypothetical protein